MYKSSKKAQSSILRAVGHTIKYPIEQWYFAQDWLAMVYPLLCSIPFCWETFYQRKSGYLQYVTNRKSLPKYLLQRYFLSLGQVAVLIFMVSFFSAFAALYLISPAHPSEQSFMQYEAWGEMIINSPVQYVLLLSIWRIVPSCLSKIACIAYRKQYIFSKRKTTIFSWRIER